MIFKFNLKTPQEGLYDITQEVKRAVTQSDITDGIALVYCPHTTGAITVNENADPDVVRDLTMAFNHFFPDLKGYKHAEGNSRAHLLSSIIGPSETFIIEQGRLVLGTWQGIYFCEFDPPRNRTYYVKVY